MKRPRKLRLILTYDLNELNQITGGQMEAKACKGVDLRPDLLSEQVRTLRRELALLCFEVAESHIQEGPAT